MKVYGEWRYSTTFRPFSPKERIPGTRLDRRGCVDPRYVLNDLETRQFFCPCRRFDPGSWISYSASWPLYRLSSLGHKIKMDYCNSKLHSLLSCSFRTSLVRRYRSCNVLVTYPNLRSVTFSPPVTIWRPHTARLCSPHNIRTCSRDHPTSWSMDTFCSSHRDTAQSHIRPSSTEVKNVYIFQHPPLPMRSMDKPWLTF
jgi:hypothetical protein